MPTIRIRRGRCAVARDHEGRSSSLRRLKGSMEPMQRADEMPLTLLKNPWESQLSELLSLPRQTLLLACPFITRPVADWVSQRLAENTGIQQVQILFLTNIRLESVLAGVLELEGLAQLGRSFARLCLVHMPSLHAKVYVADEQYAIITSGNLTGGGLRGNYEYGVGIRSPERVREIRRDFDAYSRLGAPVSVDEITALALEIGGLRKEYRARQRRVIGAAGRKFAGKLRSAQDRVLRFRAKGRSNQAIFRSTIEYLLSKGPLRTTDLHPLIQQIHPDICDDSIDRVIDGLSFGKKWKHHVRTAQQALKREGRVSFDGERWHLLPT